MANATVKPARTITLKRESQAEFNAAFRAAKTQQDPAKKYIRNIPVKTFNGDTYDRGADQSVGRSSNEASITVNFGKMSDAMGVKGQYRGATKSGRPIEVTRFEDPSRQNDDERYSYSIEVDPVGLATATFEERKANAAKNGASVDERSKERLQLNYSFSSAKSGVAAINPEIMASNIAKVGTQRYMLVASAKDPNKEAFSKNDVQKLAECFVSTYEDTLAQAAAGKLTKGLTAKSVDASGKVTEGAAIEGTQIPKLPTGMKLTTVTVDGADVQVVAGAAGRTSELNKWLVGVNNYFNAQMSQVINGTPELRNGDMTRKLGMVTGINSYAVTPVDKNADMNYALIQPATTGKINAYAQSVIKAHDAATYYAVDGVERGLSQIYSQDVLDKAAELNDVFRTPSTTREKAQEAAKDMLAKVETEIAKTKMPELKAAEAEKQSQLGD